MMRSTTRISRGFTLVEACISVVIVAMMMVAAVGAIGTSARLRLTQKQQYQGQALTKQLLDEIMQTRYVDEGAVPLFGPELGETRSTYNDVDDYNGLSQSPPANRDGTAVPGYTGWTRSVQVFWADPTNPANTTLTDSGLKRVVVTVTSPSGRVTKLTALRSNKSAYEDDTAISTTYTSWIGITVQVGNDPTTAACSAVSPLNEVP
jgi:MSHA pilin protein MshD